MALIGCKKEASETKGALQKRAERMRNLAENNKEQENKEKALYNYKEFNSLEELAVEYKNYVGKNVKITFHQDGSPTFEDGYCVFFQSDMIFVFQVYADKSNYLKRAYFSDKNITAIGEIKDYSVSYGNNPCSIMAKVIRVE